MNQNSLEKHLKILEYFGVLWISFLFSAEKLQLSYK